MKSKKIEVHLEMLSGGGGRETELSSLASIRHLFIQTISVTPLTSGGLSYVGKL